MREWVREIGLRRNKRRREFILSRLLEIIGVKTKLGSPGRANCSWWPGTMRRQGIMKCRGLNWRRQGETMLGLAGFAASAVLLVAFLVPGAWADDPATPAPQPPARAVRLSSVDGQVQLALGGQVLASPAVANTPLFEGTILTTGDNGRAEVQFEDGSVARLSPNSSFALNVLRGTDAAGDAEITLKYGLGYFELQGATEGGAIRVRFGDSQVTAAGATLVRINMDNPPGELAVFSGSAHLARGNPDRSSSESLDLHGGESVALSSAFPDQDNISESIEPDSWDTWNSDRDEALTAQEAMRTDAASSVGENNNPARNDLDANGSWYNVPGQGEIWSPNEASDSSFDPYGNGNWMWTPGYGYIFVSGYPWGYMPFACGNWNYYNSFGWGWAPGAGGCSGWWVGGIYGGPNIGAGFGGYRPPIRPRWPRNPIRRTGVGGGPLPLEGAHPMIAVNRKFPSGATSLPARDRTTMVTIAGHSVQALRPLSPRPQYSRSAFSSSSSGREPYGGLWAAPGGATHASSGYSSPGRPATAPARPASRPNAAPRPAASHAAAAPSHASSGGHR